MSQALFMNHESLAAVSGWMSLEGAAVASEALNPHGMWGQTRTNNTEQF